MWLYRIAKTGLSINVSAPVRCILAVMYRFVGLYISTAANVPMWPVVNAVVPAIAVDPRSVIPVVLVLTLECLG